jgi:hypothetical protein
MRHIGKIVLTAAALILPLLATRGRAETPCIDGLVMLGRSLPYAGLEIEERKVAHTLLSRARRAAESGDDATCRRIGGEIVAAFILNRPNATTTEGIRK